MHPSEGFWLFKVTDFVSIAFALADFFAIQGTPCFNSSIYHYGSAFGDESKQTSMPTCMNRVHANYSWRSKAVPESSVCNKSSACFVDSRPAAHIAKASFQSAFSAAHILQCISHIER